MIRTACFSFTLHHSWAYLRGDGGETAAEVHVLVDLAAIGRQEPVPKGLVFTRRLVAMALIGQELCQVPVVRRRGSDQCDEDGFRGHVELGEQTQTTINGGNANQQARKP